MKTIQWIRIMIVGALVAGMFPLTSCEDEVTDKSGEKELSNFRLSAGGKIFSGVLQSDGKTIKFTADFGFDQETLKEATPSFDLSKKAKSEPASGVPQDFTKDVAYVVTAEDGTTASYIVQKVNGTTSDAAVLAFSLYAGGDEYEGTIDEENSIISFSPTLAVWSYLNEAMPTFMLSPGATSDPVSGVAQDFTQDVVFQVTAYDGTQRNWTVKRTQRTGNAIEYFYLKPTGYDRITGSINAAAHTVTIAYPLFGADFTPAALNMAPEVIQISPGATVSPNWNEACDFSQDVTYTVTAENGEQQEWTIMVPTLYLKRKWYVDAKSIFGEGAADDKAEGVNSAGLIGNYLAFSRSTQLLNKSDGTLAGVTLDITGVGDLNSAHPPFFIANDDAGNLIGCTLGAWKTDQWTVFKWTQHDAAPAKILEFPTVAGVNPAPSLGRKLTVVGDVNGTAKIVSSDVTTKAFGGHYLWSVTGGAVNPASEYIATGFEAYGNAYQVLTPLSPDNNNAFYLLNHYQYEREDVKLRYGNVDSWTEIFGPLSTGSWNPGWGLGGMSLYQKLFSFDGKNYLAVFTAANHPEDKNYYFTIVERHDDGTHTFLAKAQFAFTPSTHPNGNQTGSLTFEKVGDDLLFYVFATGQAIVCYQMSAF
ncbi:MAG: DUF5018 domain-containing protein [Bacteroidales bacterium]|jgi:hypothetical protein|nr:DUF5018 domain-containing protein [Bacteroidales bacterium]